MGLYGLRLLNEMSVCVCELTSTPHCRHTLPPHTTLLRLQKHPAEQETSWQWHVTTKQGLIREADQVLLCKSTRETEIRVRKGIPLQMKKTLAVHRLPEMYRYYYVWRCTTPLVLFFLIVSCMHRSALWRTIYIPVCTMGSIYTLSLVNGSVIVSLLNWIDGAPGLLARGVLGALRYRGQHTTRTAS